MNGNSDHKKPLSPEELFGLIDASPEQPVQGEPLDDFEREALEGFSAHTTASKARALTEDLHRRIEAASGKNEQRHKRPAYIWLAAAASLALIIMLSAYWLMHQGASEEGLAFNQERPLPEKPNQEQSEATAEQAELEKMEQAAPDGATTKTLARKKKSFAGADSQLTRYHVAQEVKELQLADQSLAGAAGGQGQADKDVAPSSVASGTSDLNVSETQADELSINRYSPASGNRVPETKPETKLRKKEKNKDKQPTQVTANDVASASDAKRSAYKSKADAFTEQPPKASQPAPGKALEEELSKVAAPLANFYAGGEPGLKADLLKWFTIHAQSPPSGLYHLHLNVKAGQTVDILELRADQAGAEPMLRNLKEALKSLKGWNNQAAGESDGIREITFDLSF